MNFSEIVIFYALLIMCSLGAFLGGARYEAWRWEREQLRFMNKGGRA